MSTPDPTHAISHAFDYDASHQIVGGLLDHYSAANVIEAMAFLNKTTCAAPKNDRKQVLKYWLDLIDNLSDILTHVYLEEMGNTDTHY